MGFEPTTSTPRAVKYVARRALDAALDQPPTLGDSDCEALHAGFFTQPVNTVTSAAFIGVGGWLGIRVASLEPAQRLGAATFSALVVMNGVGSVAYHGPQFAGSQTLHDLPIYGMLAMSAGVPVWRRSRRRAGLPGWSGARGVGLVAAGLVGAASYVGGRTASRTCDPDSWLQFHGLWHLSTAAVAATWATVLWPRIAAGGGSRDPMTPTGQIDGVEPEPSDRSEDEARDGRR